VAKAEKRSLLQKLIRSENAKRSIVFTRTKHGANRLAEQLSRAGIEAEAIHGNKSQGARERALEGFKSGGIPVLVATDIAARGIDVDGITHVFNFDLPNVPESYVHRIGRTARAGARGRAIAFCDVDERVLLRDIERFIKRPIPVATVTTTDDGFASVVPVPAVAAKPTNTNAIVMPGDSTRARRSRRYRGARLY
jgi:ATP-dependent RNA helicase RhlE